MRTQGLEHSLTVSVCTAPGCSGLKGPHPCPFLSRIAWRKSLSGREWAEQRTREERAKPRRREEHDEGHLGHHGARAGTQSLRAQARRTQPQGCWTEKLR